MNEGAEFVYFTFQPGAVRTCYIPQAGDILFSNNG